MAILFGELTLGILLNHHSNLNLEINLLRTNPQRQHFLRRHCVMHVLNLGLLHVILAEGLLLLAEDLQLRSGCCLEMALDDLFNQFKTWCSSHKIQTSQRRWKTKNLHLHDAKGVPQFPLMLTKAFNGRVILAFLADSSNNLE